jgi:hypothetical protein
MNELNKSIKIKKDLFKDFNLKVDINLPKNS